MMYISILVFITQTNVGTMRPLTGPILIQLRHLVAMYVCGRVHAYVFACMPYACVNIAYWRTTIQYDRLHIVWYTITITAFVKQVCEWARVHAGVYFYYVHSLIIGLLEIGL